MLDEAYKHQRNAAQFLSLDPEPAIFSHGGLEITKGEKFSTGRKPSSENYKVVWVFFNVV